MTFIWFAGWITRNWSVFRDVVTAASKLLLKLGSFVVALSALIVQFVDVAAGLDSITAIVEQATAMLQSSPVVPVMDQVNVLLPLNEFIVLSGLLLAAQIGATVVRLLIRVITLGIG